MTGSFEGFATPAHQGPKDFKAVGKEQELQAFLEDWSANVQGWTRTSVIGNPWSSQFDAPRAWYFDPAVAGWPEGPPVAIEWTPFPNRLSTFFGSPESVQSPQLSKRLSMGQIYALADAGEIELNGTTLKLWNPKPEAKDVLLIPKTKCPQVDWTGKWVPFSPPGPRGWLDEYCEWSITYSDPQHSKIKSVMFTCENPGYWLTLWRRDPEVVLALYQKYIDQAVKLDDLYLRYTADTPTGKKGDPVQDPTTGRPAYDPTNKWNAGTLRQPGKSGGAIHLTSPPNTLSAEIYLAAASTIQRESATSSDPQQLICCSQYGQNFRNSDPHIGASGNAVSESMLISLADPVGLYLQTPNWDLFETPDKTPASAFWTVTRGVAEGDPNGPAGMDSILHAVFEVPDAKGYTVSDIKINGKAIHYAGQIAETFKIALRVTAKEPASTTPPNKKRPCVAPQIDSKLQPWPVQLVPETLFYGLSATDQPALLRQGATTRYVLIVQGASKDTSVQNARIQFATPGLSVEVVKYLPDAAAIPGQTDGGGTQGYIMEVTVPASATPGPVELRVLNPWEDADPSTAAHPYETGLATVVPPLAS